MIVSFLVSLIITLMIVRYEHLHSHMTADYDMNSIQKFHVKPVPRVGGVAIYCGLIFSAFYELIFQSHLAKFIFCIIIACGPAFFSGLAEDTTKRVSVRVRLAATFISAAMGGFLLDAWITRLDIPIIDILFSLHIVSIVFTCFAVAGVANSFNIIDGYNGLSSMVAIIIMGGLSYVAFHVGDSNVGYASLSAIGAIAGFLLWNYPRGLIFMGDSGAYLVGFLVAELSVLLVSRNPEVSPWFPLMLTFYPIFETVFTIFRRVAVGRTSPSLPDAAHLHQLIYRRVVRWAVGDECHKRKIQRNAMTSPYLWAMALFAVIPAVAFWNSTTALAITSIAFAILYITIYMAIYKSIFPKWLSINKRSNTCEAKIDIE